MSFDLLTTSFPGTFNWPRTTWAWISGVWRLLIIHVRPSQMGRTPLRPHPPHPRDLLPPGKQSQTGHLQSSETREMGVNGEVLCKHWWSLWKEGNHTDQIYAGGGDGIWRRNTNYKKAGGPGVIISADADTEEERWLIAGAPAAGGSKVTSLPPPQQLQLQSRLLLLLLLLDVPADVLAMWLIDPVDEQ